MEFGEYENTCRMGKKGIGARDKPIKHRNINCRLSKEPIRVRD